MFNELEPYDLLIKHENTIVEILHLQNDQARNTELISKQVKELSEIFAKLYSHHTALDARVQRIERILLETQ